MNCLTKLILGAACLAAVNTHAITVIDTYPGWSGNSTGGWEATAQTFTVPLTDSTLDSWQFGLHGRSAPSALTFSIFQWLGTSTVGPALFSTSVAWGTSDSDPLVPINLSLAPGGLYGAVFTLPDGSPSVHWENDFYPGGHGFWGYDGVNWTEFAGLDHKFRATFGGGTTPVPDSGATVSFVAFGLTGLAIAKRILK